MKRVATSAALATEKLWREAQGSHIYTAQSVRDKEDPERRQEDKHMIRYTEYSK